MNHPFEISPDWLTAIGYAILGILAVWIGAHALAWLRCRLTPLPRRWKTQADEVVGQLERITNSVARHRRNRRLKETLADEGQIGSSYIFRESVAGPNFGLCRWLEDNGCKIDSMMMSMLADAEEKERINNQIPTPTSLALLVKRSFRAITNKLEKRLNVTATMCTLAGAGPTMTGVMSFLRDYTAMIESGAQGNPLIGIHHALLTTFLGIVLALVTMTLSGLGQRLMNAYEPILCHEVERIHQAYREWFHETTKSGKDEQ